MLLVQLLLLLLLRAAACCVVTADEQSTQQQQHALLLGTSAPTKPPMLSVKDFGATGDGETDDTNAVQAAIDALCMHDAQHDNSCRITGNHVAASAIVIFPPGTYIISRTLNTSGLGNFWMGSGSGMWSSPKLVWNGPINGTLLAVQDFHSGFRLENFLLDGNKRAAHLVHVRVRTNPSGSTHNSQLSNLQFTGYRSYALILGTNDERNLAAGELSDVVCNFLVFSGSVVGSSGILINAQNMEIGSFYSIRFDPTCTIGNGKPCPCQTYVDGGTCPAGCLNNTCDSVHRHHIWHKAGRVEIYGMVSTRSDPRNYAIEAFDMIGIHGWNSEDRKLLHANFIPFGGPSVVTGVHQRGWLAQPTVRHATLIRA